MKQLTILLLSFLFISCGSHGEDPVPTKLTDGTWIRIDDSKERLNFQENTFHWNISGANYVYNYTKEGNKITYYMSSNPEDKKETTYIIEDGILKIFNGRHFKIKW